jgi:hypothetical protein
MMEKLKCGKKISNTGATRIEGLSNAFGFKSDIFLSSVSA